MQEQNKQLLTWVIDISAPEFLNKPTSDVFNMWQHARLEAKVGITQSTDLNIPWSKL